MGVRKEYSNGEVTVVWEPEKCIHSGICASGLSKVFKPNEKPWIDVDAAKSEELMHQIDKCPSGALSYFTNGAEKTATVAKETKVEVMKNGPLLVHGDLEVVDSGTSEIKQKMSAFCRCGASSNKPYCDGSHKKIGFEG
jgi:uncharacterized Fe-S cluster protein YjdI